MRAPRSALVLAAALLLTVAAFAGSARAAPPAGCPVVKPHVGNTSGDWEAVFGSRALLRRAVTLRARVRAKGFRCAVIENERRTHEIAIIGLSRRRAAETYVTRARRLGLAAHVARS